MGYLSSSFKKTVFHILIIGNDNTDHKFLRTGLTKLTPQSLIESIYDERETVEYFDYCSLPLHLILLDMKMPDPFLRLVLYIVRHNEPNKRTPIVMINSNNNMKNMEVLRKLGASEFYMESLKGIMLKVLLRDVMYHRAV